MGWRPITGGGGQSIPFGPTNNIFGATSGSRDLNTITIAASKAIAEATRLAYETANVSWVNGYTDIGVKIQLYYQDSSSLLAQDQQRIGVNWVDIGEPVIAIRGLPGDAATVANLTAGHVPVKSMTDEELVDSGMQLLSTGQMLAPKDFGVESGSIDMGDLIRISEAGGFLGITNMVTGLQFNVVDFFTPRSQASSRPQVFATTEAERLFEAQPTDTSVITTNPLTFAYTTTLAARTNSLTLRANGPMTNMTMRITDTVSGVAFKYLPDKASWLASEGGYDFIAGDNTVDLLDSPLPFAVGRALTIDIKGDNVDLLGTPTIPYFAAMLQNAEFRAIPYSTDVGNQDHPVTLRRDMPSETDAQALVDSSLNNNSALWVVASDQLVDSNEDYATITALRAGMFDLNGDEISTTPVSAETVQLRGGTTVRLISATDYRIVNSPVFESDIHNGGSKPSIHSLSSDIPNRVDLNTNLNVSHSFTFDVSNYSQLTDLDLVVNAGTDKALTIPISDGAQSQSVTLSGIDTSSDGSVSFQLRGTYSGGFVESNTIAVQVRNLEPHELTYVNAQDDQVVASFNASTANSGEYKPSQSLAIPAFAGSKYAVIGQPASENDITSLVIGGIDQIGTFTKSPDTTLINGVAYEFYFSNNALLGSVVSNIQITIVGG